GRNMVLQVKGLYWIRAGMTLALSLLNVAVTVALIPYLGILGAAIGTGLGAALGAAAMTVLLHLRAGVDGPRMLAGVGRGLAPAAVVCLGLGLLVNLAPVSGWSGLFAKGAVFGLLCAGVIWVLGLNAGERNDARSLLRLGRA
ncbi:MAG TPA: polysaccharide biosynthesis C-terminal domain-containing protein, partial [Caulobacteraceae bacterium]|nr:polysaccharide biosynthesis C-terminal domain-containing protein [Caulobacteraceae bacterium]